MTDTAHRGKIEIYNSERGYGYIRADDGSAIFLHATEWMSRNLQPAEKMQVSFVRGTSHFGKPRAMNVRAI
jgi:cold shock CspA family protein